MNVRLPDGSRVDVRIVRKSNMKRIILHCEQDGEFWISMPYMATDEDARHVILDSADWIIKTRAKMESRPKPEGGIWYLGKHYKKVYEESPTPDVRITEDSFIISGPTEVYADEYLEAWWKHMAAVCFEKHIEKWYPMLKRKGIAYPSLSVRKMKTRWGSCSWTKGTMRLNSYLFCMDEDLIDYVVLHEMAHFLFPNHEKKFRDCLTTHMPDWRERKERLNLESKRIDMSD